MEGRLGVAARLFVVLGLAGAGFAVGYLVAPHDARTPAKEISTNAAAQHAATPTISMHSAAAVSAIPALVVSKPAHKAAHRASSRPRVTPGGCLRRAHGR